MSEKTHWKKIVSDPNYIGEADFAEGEEKVLTIARINQSETVATAEGKSQKAVAHWREPGNKPMILNVARSKSIEKVSGSGFFEDWPGVQVQLYIERGIKAFGDIVNAVRVRPYKPRILSEVPPCAECGGTIEGMGGRSAAYVASLTAKKYGRPLCAECAQAEKTSRETSEGESEGEDTPDPETTTEDDAEGESDASNE